MLAADAGDDLGPERRLAAGPHRSPLLCPRLHSSGGEVALELGDWDQTRGPTRS
jgi:hypothetical protein